MPLTLLERLQILCGCGPELPDAPDALLEKAQRELEERLAADQAQLKAGIERRDRLEARVQELEARLELESDPVRTAHVAEALEVVCAELEEASVWIRQATERTQRNEEVCRRKRVEIDELRAEWQSEDLRGVAEPAPAKSRQRFGALIAAALLALLIALARRGRA